MKDDRDTLCREKSKQQKNIRSIIPFQQFLEGIFLHMRKSCGNTHTKLFME